ncbi:protein of unknown function [Tenacibaculum sp. 190130A14a]|uniref:DUF4377 domain-containing protein n=1 Tax=Tenacibaculum polynesiense TaxID=3137857 RepID=A0ABM9PG33_9FLAO
MRKIVLGLMIVLAACNTAQNKKDASQPSQDNLNIENKEVIVLKVNAQEVDCYGAHGKQKCLQIKELGVDSTWKNQYEGIEGFNYSSGFVYNLQVEKIALKEAPQDASSIFYKLIEVLKKEKPITDEELAKFPILEVTEIRNGKDGYTAILKDDKEGLYTCTISIPNLEDNYVQLKVGDKVRIAGEYAESYPVQIFAKRILKEE